VEREARKFNALKIPKALQSALPFSSKPKDAAKRKRPGYMQRRAVIMEPEEKKVARLLHTLNTLRNEKELKQKEKKKVQKAVFEKKLQKKKESQQERERERKRKAYRIMGKKEKSQEAAANKRRRT
jgi:ribosome biogenesis protein BMS1